MIQIRYILAFSSILLTILTSCTESQQNKKNSPEELEQIDQFNIAIDEYPFINEELRNSIRDSCLNFYAERNFQRVWFENDTIPPGKQTTQFYYYLNNDTLLNVIPSYYPIEQLESFKGGWLNELQLFMRLSFYLNTRKAGLINHEDTTMVNPGISSNKSMEKFIQSKPDSLTWIDHLISYKTENQSIIELHEAINEFSTTYRLDHKQCVIDTSSINASTFSCLQKLGYKASADSTKNSKVLFQFQFNNGLETDGIIGKNTLKALEKSNYERYLQAIITLDYLRQYADSVLPKKFIRVNVPTFLLSFINEDTLAFRSKVIVGAKRSKTPSFQAKAKYVVTNPYWHVPHSIATREILYLMKKDSNHFAKKGFELLKDRKVINHDTIDWKKYHRNYFPFQIRQKFGPGNSLGKVKLLFPNKYMVYIHDTPSKHLFNNSIRAYSHGCIRTERPDSLVKLILSFEDHAYLDSLDTLYARDKESYLRLHDDFPVSIEYQTVVVDDSTHSLRIFPDIYGRLTEFIKLSKQ